MIFTGFIKISRSILDSCIWEDGYDAALYFFCLLRASHNFYGKLKPGQFYSSTVSITQALGWSRNCTIKHINSLSQKGMIDVSRDSDGTIITVIGWSEICQDKPRVAGVMPAQDMSTNAQDMNGYAQDMNIECSRFEHNQEQIDQKETRTIKLREQAFDFFWNQYPRHEERTAAKNAWMKMNVPIETLMTALENAKVSREWLQDGGKYIPRASKWLDGKWVDYIRRENREERTAWTEY